MFIKEKPETYYKQFQNDIKRVCKSYAFYFKEDPTELLSLANEVFIICYQKYTDDKISFKQYFITKLKLRIKDYHLSQKRKNMKQDYMYILQKNEILIKKESFFNEKRIKNKVKVEQNTLNLVNKIRNLCLDAEFNTKIKKYINKSQHNLNYVPKYAIFNYFFNEGYTKYQIKKAISTIKLMLQGNEI
jgi:hypothetical protein